MAIFISYSHKDKQFVDKLAANLVKHKARVWVDRWELKVGDSIVQRVQNAIKEADALIVVLSKASVESGWCSKEITAGLVRELEEKRVVILPVLLADCEIPLFLRDKLYADFRANFEDGFRVTLEAIAGVISDTLGHIKKPESYVDFGVDWNLAAGLYHLRITFVELSDKDQYSVITEINIDANALATQRYLEWEKRGLDWYERLVIMSMVASSVAATEKYLYLDDDFPKSRDYGVRDSKLGIEYKVRVSARRLGNDTGKDVYVDWGNQLDGVIEIFGKSLREAPEGIKSQVTKGIKEITLENQPFPPQL